MIKKLKDIKSIKNLVVSTQVMLLSYIQLANTNTLNFQKQGRIKDIPFKSLQARGKRFNECLTGCDEMPSMLTITVKINPLKDYESVVRVLRFSPTFSITENGLSRPKILSCEGSDGVLYQQLVKGGDDMRQDAVMEQVFENINFLLNRDCETKKRQLGIRT
jgi:phosphatidylinositol kinase/protein kinase (PI-3  family)